jgi:hypothetical protein
MHTQFGVPLEKIATVLRERFGLTVTPGGLAQILHRTARRATPTYAALCEQVRGSPLVSPDVSPDENGWRAGAVPHWLWVFATPATTVYAICPGRSFDDATTILDPDFAGVLIRDGWAPYRQFTAFPASASPRIWPPSSRPSSASCGRPASTRRTGEPSRGPGAQGLWRQSHPPRRGYAASARQPRSHHSSAVPRSDQRLHDAPTRASPDRPS